MSKKVKKRRKGKNMFIYSNYSQYGFESPEQLVEAIAKRNINNVCLVDDKGMAIPSFLKACLTYDMNVSFAISFSCFIEGEETRKKGYFISSEKKGVESIFHTIEKFHEQWIPFLTHKELLILHNQGVHCFFEEGDIHQEYFLRKKLMIMPVAFLKQEDKNLHESLYRKQIGVSLDEQNENEWIKKNAKKTSDFLSLIQVPTIEVEIHDHIKWGKLSKEETKQVHRELTYFQQKNLLLPLYGLSLARKQQVPFLAHGDLYKSYLAYTLGIIPKKPSSYQLVWDEEEEFELSIVLTKKRQKEMMDVLKQTACIRHPLSKNKITPKDALKGAIKFYKEHDTYLLEKIKEKEDIQTFKKRMRVYLLTNEKQRKIVELAQLLTEKKVENSQLKRNSMVFVPEKSSFLKDEEKIYIDSQEVQALSLPMITCHFTSY